MTPLKQQISLIPFSIEHTAYKGRRFENRWDQTFCILLIKDVLSVIVSANLRQRKNLNKKWSEIRIRIFGFIWIRMSVVSVPKLWMHYLVGVSHFAKYGTNRLLIVWKLRQELSYRKQIARKLSRQCVEGIYKPNYYTATLKSRLRVLKVTGNGTIG